MIANGGEQDPSIAHGASTIEGMGQGSSGSNGMEAISSAAGRTEIQNQGEVWTSSGQGAGEMVSGMGEPVDPAGEQDLDPNFDILAFQGYDGQFGEQADLDFSIIGFEGGAFQVVDYQYSSVSSVPDSEAQGYLDTIFVISEDVFCFNGNLISMKEVMAGYYIFDQEGLTNGFRVNLESWMEDVDSVIMIVLTTPESMRSELNSNFGSTFFYVNENTIWVYYQGVFFKLKKVPSDETLVASQSFEAELNDFGQVEFLSAIQENVNPLSPRQEVYFYLRKDGEIIYSFPIYFYPIYSAAGTSKVNAFNHAAYVGISFILLLDYDEDGDKDVLVGLTYTNDYQDETADATLKVRLYEYEQEEFHYMDALNKYIDIRL